MKQADGTEVQEPGKLKAVKGIGWYIEEYGIAQLSLNLTDITVTPVHIAFDEACKAAEARGIRVTGSELVGLIPKQCDLRWSRQEITEDYALPQMTRQFPLKHKRWGFIESIQWIHTVSRTDKNRTEAVYIWTGYLRAGCLRYRLGRSLILACGYVVFLFIMLAALSHEGVPFSPCRGANNCHIDRVVVSIAAMSMIFLNMFAFDAVMLCQTFIERLNALSVERPNTTLNKCELKLRMDTKYLSRYIRTPSSRQDAYGAQVGILSIHRSVLDGAITEQILRQLGFSNLADRSMDCVYRCGSSEFIHAQINGKQGPREGANILSRAIDFSDG